MIFYLLYLDTSLTTLFLPHEDLRQARQHCRPAFKRGMIFTTTARYSCAKDGSGNPFFRAGGGQGKRLERTA